MVGAVVCFDECLDVPKAGVLCALPALLANGLLNGAKQFLGQVKGYYTTFQVLILLAFMALCRIKTTEKLRRHAPGEFGKILGLDRAPEVRCLRQKMDQLSADQGSEQWAAHRALAQLFDHLNSAKEKYPGTQLEMAFELGGYTAPNHAKGVN
jgi:hypothetical protein